MLLRPSATGGSAEMQHRSRLRDVISKPGENVSLRRIYVICFAGTNATATSCIGCVLTHFQPGCLMRSCAD